MKKTEINLSEKITEYREAEKELARLKETVFPPRPILQKAYTVPEYNIYIRQMNVYQTDVNVITVRVEGLQKQVKELKEFLKEYLPAAHVWFLTEDKKYAIAIQCSDWPMDPPKLLIKENPDINKLPKLEMQHVNSN